MNSFTKSVSQIFKGAIKAFETFPAAIVCALAFAIVTMIRIQLDWPQQEPYNFLFNCLHWAFAMGAVFSLASITAAQSRFNQSKFFLFSNLLGISAAAITFLALYMFGGTETVMTESRYAAVSGIALARVSAAIFVSFFTFIILASYPKDQSDFAKSFFMTHKAFFIALIYGVVIMSGASGVAGAVRSLLYHSMSSKVYMYIGTVSGFLAFTIFLGYFPDFRKGEIDKQREVAQKQPRFIEVLFGYIMIPIVLALTAVLLLWAGKTVLEGMKVPFLQLSSIAASFTLSGIWLHVMVTHHETVLSKFYRRIYPIAALVILVFESWALFIQLGKSGLKMTEYSFSLIWILAVAAAVLLLIWKNKAHTKIVALTCALAVFSVLPAVGYQDLPIAAQVSRLEKLLVGHGMLNNEMLIPASTEPEEHVRKSITDAVGYLANARDAKLPTWFDKSLGESDVFKTKLGFEQTWPEPEDYYEDGSGEYIGVSLMLPNEAIDISDYRWSVLLQNFVYDVKEKATARIEGDKGSYKLTWTINPPNGIPVLKIELDDRVILEEDMNDYIDRISSKFHPGKTKSAKAALEDMSLKLETPEISVLLVFNSIEINIDPSQDTINYWLNLNMLYMKEKP